ncbi:MAG: biotin synthase BioB [Bacillaceae bacterium]|nr:biotin synthase BioB [Bacillaceae bacterium]
MHVLWEKLADDAISGHEIERDEARAVLEAPDTEVPSIVAAAYRVRRHFFANKVKLNMIVNAKSGLCPEDCGYCSQSSVSEAPIDKYSLLSKDTLIAGAKKAKEMNVGTYCIVASGRGPSEKELQEVIEAVRTIKQETDLKVCTCLGILTDEQARALKEAGVDRYNHNLNTSAAHYANITSTHTYEDRVETVKKVQQSGITSCSGVIIGMGESVDDVLDMAYEANRLQIRSIPINFLNPIPGTPLQDHRYLTPLTCLKHLALFRFINPDRELRAAGGREMNLRSLQPMALYIVNSIFLGDYLTTDGQQAEADYRMIEDLGFEIEENHMERMGSV